LVREESYSLNLITQKINEEKFKISDLWLWAPAIGVVATIGLIGIGIKKKIFP
jgi:uncharacterized membrane protein